MVEGRAEPEHPAPSLSLTADEAAPVATSPRRTVAAAAPAVERERETASVRPPPTLTG